MVLVDAGTGEVVKAEVLPAGLTPPELARVAAAEHDLACGAFESSVGHAIRAGEALMAAKAYLGHGEFGPWFESEFGEERPEGRREMAPRTGQKYMKLAKAPRGAVLDAPSINKALKALTGAKDDGELVQQSLTNEWYTPTKYLDAARMVLGTIDLDPASCAEANEVVRAERYLTRDNDGLEHEWHGRVWLNPPYGRVAGPFIERLADEHAAGRVKAAVALVNAHCTDTQWFQRLWPHVLCFTDHRIDFAAGTDDRSGSTHGSVFVYLGPDGNQFAKVFAEFGAVVRRWP